MWSNVISIEKGNEKEFKYLMENIENIKELSSAIEESKSRRYIYLAGLCEYADEIRLKLENLVVELYLNYSKLNYYRRSIRVTTVNHAIVTLYSALTYLDYDFERAFILKVLTEMSSYDLEGIFHFRLRPLRKSWREVSEMCNQLFTMGADDTDIYNVISYISSTSSDRDTTLFLFEKDGYVLKNLKNGKNIKIRNVYDNDEFNLINAVVSARASRLIIDNLNLSSPLYKALRHVIRVKKS